MVRKCLNSRKGSALITSVMAMVMVSILGVAYMSLTLTNLGRAKRDENRAVAFNLAEAGVEHAIGQVIEAAEVNGGHVESMDYSSTEVVDEMVEGSTGHCTVTPDTGNNRQATITASATYRQLTETIRVRISVGSHGIWDNAIFAGIGQAGKGINGNVDIRGSVHILGEGDPFSDLNGNGMWDGSEVFVDSNGNGAFEPGLGETFSDTDGNGVWTSAEPYQDNNMNGGYDPPLTATELATDISGNALIGNNYNGMPVDLRAKLPSLVSQSFGGETVETLNAELRVKHGRVNISGNATVGDPNVTGNSLKETVDGVFVSDGYGGNKGASSVYSDNGSGQRYDLGDRMSFPSLFDPWTDRSTGISYPTYGAYLRGRALLVAIPKIDGTVNSFATSDGTNSIAWNATTKTITISGIVRINGMLDLGKRDEVISYQGSGTLFVESDIRVHGNVVPVHTFATTDALGCISGQDIFFATGDGEAQLKSAGAWYAQRKIVSAKQNKFAGTYVANYFDMGTNVPNIYQVPELANHLPPGMPGADNFFTSVQVLSWKRL